MRFDVITLFPEMVTAVADYGITGRAADDGLFELHTWNPRRWGAGVHQAVDDRPYGGGPGMVMMVEPLARALDAVRASQEAQGHARTPVWLFTPTGRRLDQGFIESAAVGPGAVLMCGRYEGVDQRFIDCHVDTELSLGDFVLSGGELPALALLDAVARLQPGVLGDAASHQQDSFSQGNAGPWGRSQDGLLDCPHYSRPEVWTDRDGHVHAVPPVLSSGHHGDIARWRREQSLRLTARRRPDLIARARAAGLLDARDEQVLRQIGDTDAKA